MGPSEHRRESPDGEPASGPAPYDPISHRVLGLFGALAGVEVLVSYFVRFQPALLEGENWTQTRPRQAHPLRAVLMHAWAIFLVAAFVAWFDDFLAN